jgi:hypothetical protein
MSSKVTPSQAIKDWFTDNFVKGIAIGIILFGLITYPILLVWNASWGIRALVILLVLLAVFWFGFLTGHLLWLHYWPK